MSEEKKNKNSLLAFMLGIFIGKKILPLLWHIFYIIIILIILSLKLFNLIK